LWRIGKQIEQAEKISGSVNQENIELRKSTIILIDET
jgi:hypothetical protein